MNIDINGSFESGWAHGLEISVGKGWHTVVSGGEIQEIKVPDFWHIRWADDTVVNPYYDGTPGNEFSRPEIDLKEKHELPLHEQDLFVRDGGWTLKPFASHAWQAEFLQNRVLEPGFYEFEVWLYPDAVADTVGGKKVFARDRAAFAYFVLDAHNYEPVDLTPKSTEETEWHRLVLSFAADGHTTFGVGLLSPWGLENSGWFADGWTLKRGEVEEGYDKKVHVLPQDATLNEAQKVFYKVVRSKGTMTYSLHDAFQRDGTKSRTVVVWDIQRVAGNRRKLNRWVKEHYPPIPNIHYRQLEPPPEPPPPPPPPTPEPLQIITLHFQDRIEGSLAQQYKSGQMGRVRYFAARLWNRAFRHLLLEQATGFTSIAKPEWVKIFIAEQAREFKAAGAKKVLVRYFSDGKYNLFASDKMAEARRLVNTYRDSAFANAAFIDAIEGTNEEPCSNNREKNEHVAAFEIALSQVHAELGLPPLASPNTAIGNIEHNELDIFIPLVEQLVRTGGYYSYHPYWPIQGDLSLPESEWKWFDERWMWHYAEFAKRGLKPKVLLTEAGPCGFGRRPDGGFGGFLATQGWRHGNVFSGSIEQKRQKYFATVMNRRARWLAWNKANDNALEAVALYTCNQPYMGWQYFRHYTEDMVLLAQMLDEAHHKEHVDWTLDRLGY